MRNPDALERRHVPMSLGRKLALAGSIGLAAVGVGGVIYEAKSIIDLRDQQHMTLGSSEIASLPLPAANGMVVFEG